MDMKDNRTEQQDDSPGIMTPDSTSIPPLPEMNAMTASPDNTPVAVVEDVKQTDINTKNQSKKSRTPLQESLLRLRRDKRAMVSAGVIVFFVLLSVLGPFIYKHIGGSYQSDTNGTIDAGQYHSFDHQELSRQDESPSGQYWLGTDQLGRDIFARLMQGMLISITVALLVEVVDIGLGIFVGVLAGYYGGWIDQVLARFTDIMFAFPGLLFVILLTGIIGAKFDDALASVPILGANGNARLLLVSMALALTAWPLMARYVRGQALQLKQQQFVEAAKTSGTTDAKIILKHIVPNLFSIVVVAATLNLSNTIVGEAGISLLGLGVQAPGSSIGLMIADAQASVDTHPLETLIPSLALAILVLAFSFLGDGLRDAFDPRSKD